MIDPAIDEFLEKEEEGKETWLNKASKTAGNRAFSTHPSTFSHPDTGPGKTNKKKKTYVTPIRHNAQRISDGFLRSGNAKTEENVETLGDAGALKVDRFLKLRMVDGRILIHHINEETDLTKELLNIDTEKYEILRQGLMEINKPIIETETNSKIKQVYFPTSDGYHQLSILTNSGLIFELKKRIDNDKFSDDITELRIKKNKCEFSDKGFREYYNLTVIGYGGAHPKNISFLNLKNKGKAYLLLSMPPMLQKRNIRFPKYNFFRESIYNYEYREIFHALHKIFKTDYNNLKIREGRDYRIQSLIDLIITRMWEVRSVCSEQYLPENSKLTRQQRVWLCDEYLQARETEDAWLDTLCKDISGWIIRTYEKLLGKSAFMLSETERVHFHNIVTGNREALR